jgi:hypothetical protein
MLLLASGDWGTGPVAPNEPVPRSSVPIRFQLSQKIRAATRATGLAARPSNALRANAVPLFGMAPTMASEATTLMPAVRVYKVWADAAVRRPNVTASMSSTGPTKKEDRDSVSLWGVDALRSSQCPALTYRTITRLRSTTFQKLSSRRDTPL